jgi:hypothetical protein
MFRFRDPPGNLVSTFQTVPILVRLHSSSIRQRQCRSAISLHCSFLPSPRTIILLFFHSTGSLLSILAVNDVYEAVRPLLIKEGVIPDDATGVRPDSLKALGWSKYWQISSAHPHTSRFPIRSFSRVARKYQLHKQAGARNFWREHDTPLKLAVALVEHANQISNVRRSRSASASPSPTRTTSTRTAQSGDDGEGSAVGTLAAASKHNPWAKMAAQQQQLATGDAKQPVRATGGSSVPRGRSVDSESAVADAALRRATRMFKDLLGGYSGDLFGQRSSEHAYHGSLIYQARMPVGGANDKQIIGRLAQRRSSAAGGPAAGGSQAAIAAAHLRRSSVIAPGEAAYSSTAAAVLANLQVRLGIV